MDTYSESKRYNDHMRTCKNILNKMKLLLNFTELPSDILIQTRKSLKELNTITNDLLELKDGHDINTSEGKQNENNEINSESRNVTQKSKFSLPKIKVENIEKEDKSQNSDSNWESDALPYNASFMSLALSANELEGVESKVGQICDSPSQTYEEKYKILRSVFFKEKINNLNINNTCICFSPVCWTRNLNCNKKDALSLIRKDSKPKQIQKKNYTFGPTNFIAMQASIPAKNDEDDESDEDEPEKIYKDVSVNTKRIKYRQISNRRVDQNHSCDSQCPYEPSVESLPFELIEYEVSQKHYITKNFPKKLKEFTRSSMNKIFDKRDGRRKNDKYPYEPSMSSLPVEFKKTDTKPQIKEIKDEEKDTDSIITVSSDEDDDLSNKEVQTENLQAKPVEPKVHIIPCDNKTCNYGDSDEESESDESTESLISLLKDEDDQVDELDDYEASDISSSLEENDEEEAEIQDQKRSVKAEMDEKDTKFCVKSTCKIEKCLNKNKDQKRDELKQEAELDDDEYEKIVDALTEQIIKCPKDIGKIYYEKGENKCNSKCSKNKDKSKKQQEPKQPTAQENVNEKVTKKDNIDDKKMQQLAKKCPAETGIYDQEYTKCPAEKCLNKDQNKKRDKRKPQSVQVDKKIIEDKNIREEPEKEIPIEEIKDAGKKSLAKCKIPIKCSRDKCTSKAKLNLPDKPKVQEDKQMVERDNVEQEYIDENDKVIKGSDENKETPVEEIRKSKYHTEFLCPSEKCKKANKIKREKSNPEEEKMLEEKTTEKEENLKNKNTRRSMTEETKNKETGNDIPIGDIKDSNTSDKSSNLEENDEEEEEMQDQNEAVTLEMDENVISCAKSKTEKCVTKYNNALTEKIIKYPKDIGKIYNERGETKCENLKCKHKDKSEPKQPTEQEYENERDQIDDKKINKDQIKKRHKPKLQTIQIEEKIIDEEKNEDIYKEPIKIECLSEKCKKKNKNKKRNRITLQVDKKIIENENDTEEKTTEDENKKEDENISLAEEDKISNEEKDEETEKEASVEEMKDICRTIKVPIRVECPGKCISKNKPKKQDKSKTQPVQVDDEIIEQELAENEKMKENTADDEKIIEKNDEIKYKETSAEASLKCPTQIAKLNKKCPTEKNKKRHRTSIDEMTETEESKVQETKQSGTDCVKKKCASCNTNPLPIIQDESTSTVQEGMKIKDMHAWALAYVKLEEDGAKLVQILHTTPYEPGRYLFKEPNELILFGPQAGSSRKSK